MSPVGSKAIFSAPDFLILGFRQDDVYVAMGSNELTQADIEAVYYEPERWDYGLQTSLGAQLKHVEIRGRMLSYYTATGPSYQDALRTLLNAWTPPERRPAQTASIPAPSREVGP